jgi:response regulator RpfG family c-di-GMP phosphodiesterase
MNRLLSLLSSRDRPELSAVPRSAPAPRVLLVEDDFLSRWRLARVLRGDGYVVIEADQAQLLKRARAVEEGSVVSEIDMVVCDAQGLDSTAITALKALRHFDWVLPIVLLSRKPSSIRQYARQLHAHAVVSDPLKVERVRTTVELVVAPTVRQRDAAEERSLAGG